MKRFLPTRPSVWLQPLSLTLLIGCVATIGRGQSLAAVQTGRPPSFNNPVPPRSLAISPGLKSAPADRTVTGAITDAATNGPLPGVNVLIKGTGTGTTTDANGQFRLNVPDDRNTLVFSYIGFVTQEVNITGRASVTITMTADDRLLNEVVVVGYGTQKRSDLTGAVASVKSEDIKNLPATDINTALQGRVPGALVQQNDGTPGSSASIIIRGPASINGNSAPLYVVDGVPQGGPSYNFNLQDVESIEVLKDASAAAIYGAQAGGGVILVTTKKGKAGKLLVSLQASAGVRTAINLPTLLNRDQFIGTKQAFGADVVDLYGPPSSWSSLPNTNWIDEVYRQGSEQNYQVSLSGGTEKSRYYLSGNYNRVAGTRISSWVEKYSFRFNSDHQLGKRLKFIETFQGTYRQDDPSVIPGINFRSQPLMPVYDATNPLGGWGRGPRGFQGDNDIKTLLGNHRESDNYEFYVSGALEYQVVTGLTARALFGSRFFTGSSYYYEPPYDVGTTKNTVDRFGKTLNRNQNYVATYTLNYLKSFGKHTIGVLAGYEARRENYAELNYANANALVPYPQSSNLVNNTTTASVNFFQGDIYNRILSQFGRIEYNYANKYLLTANVRRDGYASKFGPNNRFGVFPGVSVGWKISDESFMKNVPQLTLLKLRAGYGSLGNASFGDFAFVGNYATGYTYDFGQGRQNSITLASKIPNPDIRWESVNTTNIGLDAGLLNNRLTVNLDYYYRVTKNMIYNVGLPASAGLGGSVPANVGQLQNAGFEYNLDWRDKAGGFTYGVAFNGAFNTNKLVSLDPSLGSRAFLTNGSATAEAYRGIATSRSAPGQPIGQFFGYLADGIYQANAATGENRPKVLDYVPQAGDLIFRDLNNDGVINDDDKTYIGNPWPKLTYGINLTGGWKGFDIRAFFTGVAGNQIYNAYETYEHLLFSDFNTTAKAFETSGFNRDPLTGQLVVAGLPNSGVTRVPRIGTLTDLDKNGNWSSISSYHVQNGSYFRLRNLQIGYSIPRLVMNKLKMNALRVFVMGDNLFTITQYKGPNPDISPQDTGGGRSVLQTGIDNAQSRYPVSRLLSVGLNADF